MKLFIIALVTLTFICVSCAFGAVYGTKTIDNLISTLNEVKHEIKIPTDAPQIYKKLSSNFEKSSFLLSLLLPHHHLDEVKEKLVRLGAYSVTDEFAEWHDAVLELNEELEHIRGLVRISIDNIM